MKRLRLYLLAALSAYILAAAALAAVGLRDHGTEADLIVVPGNTVRPDGAPSARLQARLDAAIALYRSAPPSVIFVSGGVGREGRDEAAAMAAYLTAHGIASGSIVQDSLGVDTAATATNAAAYMKSHQLRTAMVVTQYFHVARTVLALERSGVHVVGTRHARYSEMRDVYSLAREVVGYAAYWARLPAVLTLAQTPIPKTP